MRAPKYYLMSLIDRTNKEIVPMNVSLPMNTPVMLIRVEGQMRFKRLDIGRTCKADPPITPGQISLL